MGAFETLRGRGSVFHVSESQWINPYAGRTTDSRRAPARSTSPANIFAAWQCRRPRDVPIGSEDDRPGAAPVAVVSFATSQTLRGPSNAIGESILVDDVPFTVVGVAPPESSESTRRRRRTSIFRCRHTNLLVDGAAAARVYGDKNFVFGSNGFGPPASRREHCPGAGSRGSSFRSMGCGYGDERGGRRESTRPDPESRRRGPG